MKNNHIQDYCVAAAVGAHLTIVGLGARSMPRPPIWQHRSAEDRVGIHKHETGSQTADGTDGQTRLVAQACRGRVTFTAYRITNSVTTTRPPGTAQERRALGRLRRRLQHSVARLLHTFDGARSTPDERSGRRRSATRRWPTARMSTADLASCPLS